MPETEAAMTNENEVVRFLRQLAIAEGFALFDCIYGSLHIGTDETLHQSSGAVYGIFVRSDVSPSPNIAELPGFANWYPVYWGKDMNPPSRVRAHVNGHAGNGNANLPGISEIRGKPLIFGAIFVARDFDFERILHERFPPLKGRNGLGRRRSRSKLGA